MKKVFLLTDDELKHQIRKYALPNNLKEKEDFNIFLIVDNEVELKVYFKKNEVKLNNEYFNIENNFYETLTGYIDDEVIECPILAKLNIGPKINNQYEIVLKVYKVNKDYDKYYIDNYECLIENINNCDSRKILLKEVYIENNISRTKVHTTDIKTKKSTKTINLNKVYFVKMLKFLAFLSIIIYT